MQTVCLKECWFLCRTSVALSHEFSTDTSKHKCPPLVYLNNHAAVSRHAAVPTLPGPKTKQAATQKPKTGTESGLLRGALSV